MLIGLRPSTQADEGTNRDPFEVLPCEQGRRGFWSVMTLFRKLVLFMSDNGGLSASGRGGKANTHNLPLSSGKGSAHEGGVRVPMIVDYPGVTNPASSCEQAVIIEAFFPTILEIAGVENFQQVGGKTDGLSFTSLLKGKVNTDLKRPIIWHFPNNWGPRGPGIGSSSAIRMGDWKLIYYHDPARKARYELFNLRDDLDEQKNLIEDNPEVRSKLAHELAEFLRHVGATMPLIKTTGERVPLPSSE